MLGGVRIDTLDKMRVTIKATLVNRKHTAYLDVLPKSRAILDSYKDNPEYKYKGKLLPLGSNQKMTEYLNEIATLCKIDKRITCHLARHTFATTITIAKILPGYVVNDEERLPHSQITEFATKYF
jgi:integrase